MQQLVVCCLIMNDTGGRSTIPGAGRRDSVPDPLVKSCHSADHTLRKPGQGACPYTIPNQIPVVMARMRMIFS